MATNMAYAQTIELSVSTSKQSYEPGETVAITGSVQKLTNLNPVTIIVRNPIGNVYDVGQVPLVGDSFSHSFVLANDAQGGVYSINVRQDDKTAQIQFQVMAVQTQTISVFDNEILVNGKNTSLIKYENVEISPADNSLTIQINASKIQNASVTEQYHIPKHVIDTSNGQLVVKENGVFVACVQTDAGVEWILNCPINADVHEITLIGTSVIPEFGSMTTIILALGIIIILIVFTQNRLSAKHIP